MNSGITHQISHSRFYFMLSFFFSKKINFINDMRYYKREEEEQVLNLGGSHKKKSF